MIHFLSMFLVNVNLLIVNFQFSSIQLAISCQLLIGPRKVNAIARKKEKIKKVVKRILVEHGEDDLKKKNEDIIIEDDDSDRSTRNDWFC